MEKDRELDVWLLEHVTYTPALPGPKREETDPSVHTWISEGGREDSLFEADWSRGGNSKEGCSPWGKRGHMIRVSREDGRD